MKVDVAHPCELGESELAIWRGLQGTRADWANPFLAPEFTVAVGQVRPGARVAVMSNNERIVGFFPFELMALGHGVPIAAGLTDCQGVVFARGLDWDPKELLRCCRLSYWEFDHLVSGQNPLNAYAERRAPSPVIDLAGGFDAYFACQRKRSPLVRDLPRRRRRLAREVGDVRFEFDSNDEQALQKLLRWKSLQYRRTGRSNRFTKPWINDLVNLLSKIRSPGFAGLLSLLYAGDELVAAHFGLRSDTIVPTWFPAYDPSYGRYSPGLLLHLALAEGAAAVGVRQIDMGRGAKTYKESLKTGELEVAEGRVARPVPSAVIHRIRRAPVRRLRSVVTSNPTLFRVADHVLKAGGRVRSFQLPSTLQSRANVRRFATCGLSMRTR